MFVYSLKPDLSKYYIGQSADPCCLIRLRYYHLDSSEIRYFEQLNPPSPLLSRQLIAIAVSLREVLHSGRLEACLILRLVKQDRQRTRTLLSFCTAQIMALRWCRVIAFHLGRNYCLCLSWEVLSCAKDGSTPCTTQILSFRCLANHRKSIWPSRDVGNTWFCVAYDIALKPNTPKMSKFTHLDRRTRMWNGYLG